MRTPDRTPGGELLVGQGPSAANYHVAIAGAVACDPSLPIAAPVPIGQTEPRRWCQRPACRRYRQGEARPVPAAAGADVEHVCPVCYVERAADTARCPSCGSAYAAVPAHAAA